MRKYILSAVAAAAVLALGVAAAPQHAVAAAHPKFILPRAITVHPVEVPHGQPAITITRDLARVGQVSSGNMTSHGGPVQQDPQVFVVFWGSWWEVQNDACTGSPGNGAADEQYLWNLYNGLGNYSDLQSPIDSQYFGPSGSYPIFPTNAGKVFTDWYVDCSDPPASATQAQLAAFANGSADYLVSIGYTITNNTQIIVVSPSGTNPGGGFGQSYCAWHSWENFDGGSQVLSYTNLPYMPDAGNTCGANYGNGGLAGWSIVGGHEYNESVTDPQGNGWYDSSGISGEIGDKCAWQNIFTQTTKQYQDAMQPEWNNKTTSCQPLSSYIHGRIKLKSNSALCVKDATTSGTVATLFSPCDSASARTWAHYPDNSLRRWTNTAACLQPAGNSTAAGAQLVVERCTGAKIQRWSWSVTANTWTNKGSGKCLRAPTASNGAALTQAVCSTAASEQFTNV